MENFEDLDDKLNKVESVDDLLDVIFDDYMSTYYQDLPPGRKKFIEKLMDKIHAMLSARLFLLTGEVRKKSPAPF